MTFRISLLLFDLSSVFILPSLMLFTALSHVPSPIIHALLFHSVLLSSLPWSPWLPWLLQFLQDMYLLLRIYSYEPPMEENREQLSFWVWVTSFNMLVRSSISLPEKLVTLWLFTAVYHSIVYMSHVLVISSLMGDIEVYFKVLSFEANVNKVVSLTPFSGWWLLVCRRPAAFCVSCIPPFTGRIYKH